MQTKIIDLEQEVEYLKVSLRETKEQLEKEKKEKLLLEKLTKLSNLHIDSSNDISGNEERLELMSEINSASRLDELLKILANELESIYSFDGYLINILESDTNSLVCHSLKLPPAYYGVEIMYRKYKFPLQERDINVTAIENKHPVYVNSSSLSEYAESTIIRFERWRMYELVAIPIIDRNIVIGTIMAFSQEEKICRSSIDLIKNRLEMFMAPLKNAIYLSNLLKREEMVKDLEKEHEEFLKFIIQINELSSVRLIYEIVCYEMIRSFSFDIATIFMEEDGYLKYKCSFVVDEGHYKKHDIWQKYFEENDYEITLSDGTPPTSYLQSAYMHIKDIKDIQHLPMSEKDKDAVRILETPRTMLAVPIKEHGLPVGVIWLFSLNNIIELKEKKLKIIDLLCSYIGAELSKAELYTTVTSQKKEIVSLNKELQNKVSVLNEHESNLKDLIEKRVEGIYKAIAKAEQASQAKSEFMANISHELRTPLNSMMILAKLLAENESRNLTSQQVEYANVIFDGGQSLLELINDILDLSKVEAGQLDIYMEKIIISELIEKVNRYMVHLAEQKEISYKTTIEKGVMDCFFSDVKRVEQIIKNLLSNAFKFTEKGSVTLTVHLPSPDISFYNPVLRDKQVIALSVIDTGIGISKEKHKTVFEAFEQADGSTSRHYGGTGLGLSISRELSNMLGGEIRLESEEGKGSTFTLYLPVGSNEEIMERKIVDDFFQIHNNEQRREINSISKPADKADVPEVTELSQAVILNNCEVLVVNSNMRQAYKLAANLRKAGAIQVHIADNSELASEKLDLEKGIKVIIFGDEEMDVAECSNICANGYLVIKSSYGVDAAKVCKCLFEMDVFDNFEKLIDIINDYLSV